MILEHNLAELERICSNLPDCAPVLISKRMIIMLVREVRRLRVRLALAKASHGLQKSL